MSDWTYQTWMDALRDVQKRAASDAGFRSRAMSDPNGAIRDVSGRDVPSGFRIRFAEHGSEMVIPLGASNGGSEELSPQQLQGVAGGSGSSSMPPYSCSPWC